MSLENGIEHIEESNGRSYCGRSLVGRFKFLNLEHAKAAKAAGSRVTPCLTCLRRAEKQTSRT